MNPRQRASARVDVPAPVRVRGLPHRLVTFTAIAVSAAEWAPVRLNHLPEPLLALVAPSGSGAAGQIKLRLPPTTAPGTYEGSIHVAGQERPVQIQVDPHTNLAVQPEEVTVSAAAGSELTLECSLLNQGNVPVDVRRAYALGLVDVQALDHGLDAAARNTPREDVRRVDVLLDELARGSGGAARLEVQDGFGPLAPGDVRNVRGRFVLPKELRAGHTYTARVRIENAVLSIRVDVPGGVTGKEVS